jgi:hypothetical protein
MRYTKIAVLAAIGALSIASATIPADARHAKRAAGWTPNFFITRSGYVYGPHYGYPTYPSFWSGPTSGVYAFDPGSVCYAPRGYPSYGLWNQPYWYWALEYIC